jgi:F420-dependent oxidoreductase-like protein
MKVSLQLPSFSFPDWPATIGATLTDVALSAERAGFDTLWVMDHLYQLPIDTGLGGPEEPMLEASTALGFVARATTRIRLGMMVGAAHFRPPGVLIKAITTLDVLSGGRAWLGIGAGWYARESLGLGIPWPERSDRFRLLEDTLRFAHHAWRDDRSPFEGRTLRAAEPIVVPQPLTRPHPPILIGGGGERTTLRLVARYADACNILVPDPGESRAKLAVLQQHCEELGRDYASILKTALVETDLRPGRQTPADVIRALRAQAEEGIEHVIVNLPQVHEPAHLETFRREIIPAVASLEAQRAA